MITVAARAPRPTTQRVLEAHPDRHADTLAQVPGLRARAGPGPFAAPAEGSADARIGLKTLLWKALGALHARGTRAAEERFAALEGEHLIAGTVRDGVARGVAVALEETISLCAVAPAGAAAGDPDPFALAAPPDKALRKVREVLVASGAARIRWTRKSGILLVDRALDVHAESCLSFEDRSDTGTLDGFAPLEGERPRLFSPAFLQPVHVLHEPGRDLLLLRGQLGRGKAGYPVAVTFEGRADEPFLRLRVTLTNRHRDHRTRLRLNGVPAELLAGAGMPLFAERVVHAHGTFLAATLVRACGRLQVGQEIVPVPDAQCLGTIERSFTLGRVEG